MKMARHCIKSLLVFFLFHMVLDVVIATTAIPVIAFAGGFGPSKPKSTGKKSKAKKKPRNSVKELVGKTKPVTPKKKLDGPQLDKWGLPIPTEADIFPRMPAGTELVSVPSNQGFITSRSKIQEAMKNHIDLDFGRFDENGLEKEPSEQSGQRMQLKLLHISPPVLVIDNFFTQEECQKVKDVTGMTRQEALQVDSATFSPLAMSKRTSTSWFCHYVQMPTLLAKAHHVLGIPFGQMEEPQIVRYRTGEEFTWHYDEVPSTQLDNGGQRLATLLVYLNTVDRGGGTVFRDLQAPDGTELIMKPTMGSALLFFPAYKDGKPDDRTLHKGEIALNEKWITQMWIHHHDYKPVVPRGNSHEAAVGAIEQVSRDLGYVK